MGRHIIIGVDNSSYLQHYGVKGMKWGIRKRRKELSKDERKRLNKYRKEVRYYKYHNQDGSLTKRGQRRAGLVGAGATAAMIGGGVLANHIIKKKTGGAYNLGTMTQRALGKDYVRGGVSSGIPNLKAVKQFKLYDQASGGKIGKALKATGGLIGTAATGYTIAKAEDAIDRRTSGRYYRAKKRFDDYKKTGNKVVKDYKKYYG